MVTADEDVVDFDTKLDDVFDDADRDEDALAGTLGDVSEGNDESDDDEDEDDKVVRAELPDREDDDDDDMV